MTPAPSESGCRCPGTGFPQSHSVRRRGLLVVQPTGRTETAEAGSDRSTRLWGARAPGCGLLPPSAAPEPVTPCQPPQAVGGAEGNAQTRTRHAPVGPRRRQLWDGVWSGAVPIRWVQLGRGDAPRSRPLISETPEATDSGATQRHSELCFPRKMLPSKKETRLLPRLSLATPRTAGRSLPPPGPHTGNTQGRAHVATWKPVCPCAWAHHGQEVGTGPVYTASG